MSVLEGLPAGARVLVVRLRSLGDCVLTTPALEILRSARADLEMAVAVEDRFAAVFEGNPDVDRLLPPSLAGAALWRPQLCLNLHGGPRGRLLAAASMAPVRAGFAHHRGAWIYNQPIPTAQEILGVNRKVHTAEHLASAIFHLGAPRREIPPAKLFARPERAAASYAVLHPTASSPEKTWPADRFRSLADRLRSLFDLEPVFIAGAGEDLGAFAGYRTVRGASLGEVKNLLAGASLFVGNDSGPAHMAAALGIPELVLFGPSDPAIWGPWRAAAEVLSEPGGIGAIRLEAAVGALERLSAQDAAASSPESENAAAAFRCARFSRRVRA